MTNNEKLVERLRENCSRTRVINDFIEFLEYSELNDVTIQNKLDELYDIRHGLSNERRSINRELTDDDLEGINMEELRIYM